MARVTVAVLPGVLLLTAAWAAPRPKPAAPDTFLVEHDGLRLLGPDGREKERVEPSAINAALSPDGRWLAGIEFDREASRCRLVLRPRGRAGEPVTVPLLWDQPGRSGCLPVWAADGDRLLIGENRPGDDGRLEYAHRVYDMKAKSVSDVRLPDGCWATGWSPDGRRLLTTVWPGDGTTRLAWVAADGKGRPEFLTGADEVAHGGRLSPDGKRVLCLVGPKAPKDGEAGPRLTAIDLATGRRAVLDEPGHTHGYCWSPDGSRVAYTWQRPLADPAGTAERETLLITCTAEGKDPKTVTSRKHEVSARSSGRAGVVYFFTVVDWR